jgi:hypothetical protein
MLIDAGHSKIIVEVLYGATRTIERFEFDAESAEKVVMDVLSQASVGTETPGDGCDWCGRKLVCGALRERRGAIANGREDWPLKTYHTSAVEDDPVELGRMLRLARLMSKWCDAAEFHAKQAALKRGVIPDGFEIRSGAGKKSCTDVAGAFERTGLPQEVFLGACDLRLNTSKKYPDRVGLIELYAKHNEMPKAGAKREITKRLEPVMSHGVPSMRLVATGDDSETSTED